MGGDTRDVTEILTVVVEVGLLLLPPFRLALLLRLETEALLLFRLGAEFLSIRETLVLVCTRVLLPCGLVLLLLPVMVGFDPCCLNIL